MAYDLAQLTYTPDMRHVDPARGRIVCALRYCHVARSDGRYCARTLACHLGSRTAVASFHVLLDEAGHTWPERIAVNPPCAPEFSYDEMILADLCMAAAYDDRLDFDEMVEDMLGPSARHALWCAARRLMRILVGTPQ